MVALLCALAGAYPVVLFLLGPHLVESRLGDTLSKWGVEIGQLEVERVGPTSSQMGAGKISYGEHTLGWRSLQAAYRPLSLMDGQIDNIILDKPVLHLFLPEPGEPVSFPQNVLLDGSAPVEVSGQLPAVRTDTTYTDSQPDRKEADNVELADSSVMEESLQYGIAGTDLTRWLSDLPVGGGFLEDGVLDVDLGNIRLLNAGFESQFVRRADGVSGKLTLDDRMISSLFTLESDPTLELTTVFGEMEFRATPLMELFTELKDAGWDEAGYLESLSIQTPVHGKVLLESRMGGALQISSSISTDFFTLNPPWLNLPPISVRDVLLVATYREGLPGLEGGGRIPQYSSDYFSIEPFGFMVSSNEGSVLLAADPVGLRRTSTVWLEELSIAYAPAGSSFDGGCTWYNGSGKRMGDIQITGWQDLGGNLSAEMNLSSLDDGLFLESQFSETDEGFAMDVGGKLPPSWLNALGDWWWGRRFSLSGEAPTIQSQLSQTRYLMRGSIDVGINGSDLLLPSGLILKNMVGECRIRINGLPSSDGEQSLRVEALATGNLRLHDLDITWALPNMRNFLLTSATARLEGGEVSLDSFNCDPLDPVLETNLRIAGLPAQQLLDWIGERRFQLQGTVSGSLPIRWADGVLSLGQAEMRLDSSFGDTRLLFADEPFLKDQFAQMGGVPESLKEPFLATLLSDGIRIRKMSLVFAPDPAKGEVVLRLMASGEARSDLMEVPIESLVINNVISDEDLARVLGFLGPVEFIPAL